MTKYLYVARILTLMTVSGFCSHPPKRLIMTVIRTSVRVKALHNGCKL